MCGETLSRRWFRIGITCQFTLGLALARVGLAQEIPQAVARPDRRAESPVPPGAGGPVAVSPDGKPVPPGAAAKPPGDAKPEEKQDQAAPKAVTRPDKPPLPPDPRELKVEPDPDGKIRFNFHGQPWADVLEWLARISAMSLDWQELPADYLNLVTQREYTVPEARDLINRHLLARGYTMLVHGEILSVVKIEKIMPGMVPRVEPAELANRMPHEYVKVSFSLDWLISERLVEELKPMLSTNSKITPLKNTNRVEAMDAVINLREIHELLEREQSTESDQRLVREFALNYTRAEDVLEQLKTLLGMESKSSGPSGPMSREQMQMMQQQQQMMMQQMQQQGGNPAAAASKKLDGDVKLVANTRKNSILANAPPDKMEIIAQAVHVIDVENDDTVSLLTNINRMRVHRLHSIDPAALVKTLMEIGQLDPATRLEVDEKNKAVIAYASLADQLTIQQVIERLDGSIRSFEVIPLRRLEADYVAGTIDFMMNGPAQPQQQSRYYDYYSPFRRNENEDKTDKFRVDADVANNKLLLWANEVELQEVNNLLVKMGEIPAQGGRNERVRVLDPVSPEELENVLDRLRRVWPSLSPNPLQLPEVPPAKAASDMPPARPALIRPEKEVRREKSAWELLPVVALRDDPEAKAESPPLAERPSDFPPADAEPPSSNTARKPSNEPPSAATPRAAAGQNSPIDVSITPDGRLMITSQDTQALDLLEELIGQVAPPRRDYHVFKLKFADAFWVKLNLKDFFEEEDDKKNSNSSRMFFYYDDFAPRKDEPSYRLSKRRKLKFIDDPDTNTILVQGADDEQLHTIAELIKVYDRPQEADANAARHTAVFQIKHSKAQVIADAVKDLYRDLLSSNDRALQQNQNPEQKNRPSSATTYIYNDGNTTTGSENDRTRVSFKGKVSIGVDELSNTLLVSTEGEVLMRKITEMVEMLDEAAKPVGTVSVVKLNGFSNSEKVRQALTRLLAEPKSQGKKTSGTPQPGQPGQPGSPNDGAVQPIESDQ